MYMHMYWLALVIHLPVNAYYIHAAGHFTKHNQEHGVLFVGW
jgi:hypothetical protein